VNYGVDYDWILRSTYGVAPEEEGPEFRATEAQRRKIIEGALGRLSPRHRKLILMRFGPRQATFEQIGAEFGLSRDGAHHAVRRTLKMLRDDLGRHHSITELRQI
jgi:DNA-directed RNA polymerase sigma subunit (sigma70/sigma32)